MKFSSHCSTGIPAARFSLLQSALYSNNKLIFLELNFYPITDFFRNMQCILFSNWSMPKLLNIKLIKNLFSSLITDPKSPHQTFSTFLTLQNVHTQSCKFSNIQIWVRQALSFFLGLSSSSVLVLRVLNQLCSIISLTEIISVNPEHFRFDIPDS